MSDLNQYRRFPIEPPFCPLHKQPAPCMECLLPEITQKVNSIVAVMPPNGDQN